MSNVMAALPNIGGALCEISVISFLVPRHKVWLTPAAGVPCSNATNIVERKTWTWSKFCTRQNSARGQWPPKMYIYSILAQGTAKHHAKFERRSCSNEAKTRNPLKFAGVPKPADRSQPLVGRRLLYYEDIWRRYCCLWSPHGIGQTVIFSCCGLFFFLLISSSFFLFFLA